MKLLKERYNFLKFSNNQNKYYLFYNSLEVEKLKDTQYTGGNVCISSCGSYMFCIFGSSCNIIELNTGNTVNSLESVIINKLYI
jgi:hypothetical protein